MQGADADEGEGRDVSAAANLATFHEKQEGGAPESVAAKRPPPLSASGREWEEWEGGLSHDGVGASDHLLGAPPVTAQALHNARAAQPPAGVTEYPSSQSSRQWEGAQTAGQAEAGSSGPTFSLRQEEGPAHDARQRTLSQEFVSLLRGGAGPRTGGVMTAVQTALKNPYEKMQIPNQGATTAKEWGKSPPARAGATTPPQVQDSRLSPHDSMHNVAEGKEGREGMDGEGGGRPVKLRIQRAGSMGLAEQLASWASTSVARSPSNNRLRRTGSASLVIDGGTAKAGVPPGSGLSLAATAEVSVPAGHANEAMPANAQDALTLHMEAFAVSRGMPHSLVGTQAARLAAHQAKEIPPAVPSQMAAAGLPWGLPERKVSPEMERQRSLSLPLQGWMGSRSAELPLAASSLQDSYGQQPWWESQTAGVDKPGVASSFPLQPSVIGHRRAASSETLSPTGGMFTPGIPPFMRQNPEGQQTASLAAVISQSPQGRLPPSSAATEKLQSPPGWPAAFSNHLQPHQQHLSLDPTLAQGMEDAPQKTQYLHGRFLGQNQAGQGRLHSSNLAEVPPNPHQKVAGEATGEAGDSWQGAAPNHFRVPNPSKFSGEFCVEGVATEGAQPSDLLQGLQDLNRQHLRNQQRQQFEHQEQLQRQQNLYLSQAELGQLDYHLLPFGSPSGPRQDARQGFATGDYIPTRERGDGTPSSSQAAAQLLPASLREQQPATQPDGVSSEHFARHGRTSWERMPAGSTSSRDYLQSMLALQPGVRHLAKGAPCPTMFAPGAGSGQFAHNQGDDEQEEGLKLSLGQSDFSFKPPSRSSGVEAWPLASSKSRSASPAAPSVTSTQPVMKHLPQESLEPHQLPYSLSQSHSQAQLSHVHHLQQQGEAPASWRLGRAGSSPPRAEEARDRGAQELSRFLGQGASTEPPKFDVDRLHQQLRQAGPPQTQPQAHLNLQQMPRNSLHNPESALSGPDSQLARTISGSRVTGSNTLVPSVAVLLRQHSLGSQQSEVFFNDSKKPPAGSWCNSTSQAQEVIAPRQMGEQEHEAGRGGMDVPQAMKRGSSGMQLVCQQSLDSKLGTGMGSLAADFGSSSTLSATGVLLQSATMSNPNTMAQEQRSAPASPGGDGQTGTSTTTCQVSALNGASAEFQGLFQVAPFQTVATARPPRSFSDMLRADDVEGRHVAPLPPRPPGLPPVPQGRDRQSPRPYPALTPAWLSQMRDREGPTTNGNVPGGSPLPQLVGLHPNTRPLSPIEFALARAISPITDLSLHQMAMEASSGSGQQDTSQGGMHSGFLPHWHIGPSPQGGGDGETVADATMGGSANDLPARAAGDEVALQESTSATLEESGPSTLPLKAKRRQKRAAHVQKGTHVNVSRGETPKAGDAGSFKETRQDEDSPSAAGGEGETEVEAPDDDDEVVKVEEVVEVATAPDECNNPDKAAASGAFQEVEKGSDLKGKEPEPPAIAITTKRERSGKDKVRKLRADEKPPGGRDSRKRARRSQLGPSVPKLEGGEGKGAFGSPGEAAAPADKENVPEIIFPGGISPQGADLADSAAAEVEVDEAGGVEPGKGVEAEANDEVKEEATSSKLEMDTSSLGEQKAAAANALLVARQGARVGRRRLRAKAREKLPPVAPMPTQSPRERNLTAGPTAMPPKAGTRDLIRGRPFSDSSSPGVGQGANESPRNPHWGHRAPLPPGDNVDVAPREATRWTALGRSRSWSHSEGPAGSTGGRSWGRLTAPPTRPIAQGLARLWALDSRALEVCHGPGEETNQSASAVDSFHRQLCNDRQALLVRLDTEQQRLEQAFRDRALRLGECDFSALTELARNGKNSKHLGKRTKPLPPAGLPHPHPPEDVAPMLALPEAARQAIPPDSREAECTQARALSLEALRKIYERALDELLDRQALEIHSLEQLHSWLAKGEGPYAEAARLAQSVIPILPLGESVEAVNPSPEVDRPS